jgi:hypothetical protein
MYNPLKFAVLADLYAAFAGLLYQDNATLAPRGSRPARCPPVECFTQTLGLPIQGCVSPDKVL